MFNYTINKLYSNKFKVIIESDTEVQDILGFKEQESGPLTKKASKANTADIEMFNNSPQPVVIDEGNANKLKKSIGKKTAKLLYTCY